MHRASRSMQLLSLAVCGALLASCSTQEDAAPPSTISVKHENGVSVSAPRTSLAPGATLRITTAAKRSDNWPAMDTLLGPVSIEPTKGELQGTATIEFPYPEQLPNGIAPEDLMISSYEPTLKVWLPEPFTVDRQRHRLIVTTNHFSEWVETRASDDFMKSVNSFSTDVSKDALKHNGDPAAGFFERLYPPPPELECLIPSERLDIRAVDNSGVGADIACEELIGKHESNVRVKLANAHYYPMVIKLPTGVKVEDELPESDNFEEVMSQLMAALLEKDEFLLRAGSIVNLVVDPKKLEKDAYIKADVDPEMLLTDMTMWTIGFGMDQKGAAWDELRKIKGNYEALQKVTQCFSTQVEIFKEKQKGKLLKSSSKKDQKKVQKFIQDAIKKCALPAGKAVHGLWGKIKQKGQETIDRTVDTLTLPATRMIEQFQHLWNNPSMVTAWTEGLIAGLYPGDASTVKVYLTYIKPVNATYNAYIRSVDLDTRKVTFDAIEYIEDHSSGENNRVRVACLKDRQPASETAWCNDYYIRNNNPKLRTFKVTDGAKIDLISFEGPRYDATLKQLRAQSERYRFPCKLRVVDGVIRRIEQIMIP